MARMVRATRKRLGEILVERGTIQEEELVEALKEQRRTGELLGETLVRMGYATEDDIAATIVTQFGLPYLPVGRYKIDDEVTQVFPPLLLKQYQFVPVDRMGNVLAVVAGSLLTPDILSEIEQFSGLRILVYVGKQSEVQALIREKFAPPVEGEGAKAEEPPSWLRDEE